MLSLGSWLPPWPGLAWGWALLDALLQGESPRGWRGDSLGTVPPPAPCPPVTRCCLFPAGLVGACAVVVLCSLLKVYLYIQCLK